MNFLITPTIHPLIQILITLLLCSGILKIGKILNHKFFKNYDYLFLNLSVSSILISQILFISLIFGIFGYVVVILSYFLIILGIFNFDLFKDINVLIKSLFNNKNIFFKFIIIISFLSFIIISLGPPSMSDALDYHYGVPLYLLNYSFLPNQDIWLHGSLFGYGELMSAIGLNLKTDNFFTFFQILSLVLFFEFLIKKEKDQNRLLFVLFFVISSPVILFLISGPKPLLFPQLLTTVALYLLVKEKKFNQKNLFLIGTFLLGAAQFKLSFILSGSIIGLILLIKAFKFHKQTILNLTLLTLFIFLPKIYYNLNQVSEFELINIFTTLPYDFLENLSNFKDNNFIYPINLFIPSSFGAITTILGFQVLILFFIKKISKEFKLILLITLLTIFIHLIFGQQTSRIYFEFLLWIGIGFCFLEKMNLKNKFFIYALLPQLSLVVLISIYFAANTFPSLISYEYRDKFMEKNSFEYSGIKWVNNQIPSNHPVISQLRSHSFLANEFIPYEDIKKLQETKNYIEYLRLKNPKFLITKNKDLKDHFLKGCIGNIYKVSQNLTKSTRNPFNRGDNYKVYIYHFNYDKLNYCTN